MSKEQERLAEALLLEQIKRSKSDFLFFAKSLIIPSASGPKNFGKRMADFQLKAFEEIAPSLTAVKDGTMPPKRRFWFERTKGASKDSDLAVMILWLIAFTERPILIQVIASNNRQARIVEDRALVLLHYNPWLNEYVEIVQNLIRSKERVKTVQARIEATGKAGEAQGATPDILILNELTHVDKWSVMKAHRDNARKVPRNLTIISTNAGVKGTPAWQWRKIALAEKGKRWVVSLWKGLAPWISGEDAEEAKCEDPIGTEYARLWKGEWVSGIGDALSDSDIEAMFVHKKAVEKAEKGWIYIGGLDLGVKKDHAGVTVIGINKRERRIRVTFVKGFVPSIPNDKGVLEVNALEVKAHLISMKKRFRLSRCWYDQAAGGSFMAQEMRRAGFVMKEADFNLPSWQTSMAVALVQCAKSRMLECYDDEEGRLRQDFGKFNIEVKPPNRYKLVAASDEYGHADVGFALAMILPDAVEMLGGYESLSPDDIIADIEDDDEELSDEEWEELPDEFKEWLEMEEDEVENNRLKSIYGD